MNATAAALPAITPETREDAPRRNETPSAVPTPTEGVDSPSTGRERTAPPTYAAVHSALHRRRGSASARACVICGRRAQEWACYPCDDADVIEGTNADGRRVTYVADLDGFAPLCRTHHREHDAERARRRRDLAHLAVAPLPSKTPRRCCAARATPTPAEPLFDLDPNGRMR